MKYRSGQWQRQFSDITELLKKSVASSNQYARNLFSNQQEFLTKYSNEYLANLRKIDSISHAFQSQDLFNKLSEKIKGLTSLYFSDVKVQSPIETIKIKNKRIERVLRLIQKQKMSTPLKVNGELIRSLLQQQSKFNMDFDLFVFKCFIISDISDKQPYSPTTPPLSISKQSIPKKSQVQIPIIHAYFQQDVTKIILANLPTLGTSKTVFTKAIQSKEIRQLQQNKQKLDLQMDEDNDENSKKCFHYFGHAMQFDFFNSLVQPQSLLNYIRRFSIIQDRAICQGLILGALSSIPEGKDPQCSDSDAEQQWQEEVQTIAKEFCHYFSEYFQDEEQTLEVKALSTRLAILRRQQKVTLSTMLRRYWLK